MFLFDGYHPLQQILIGITQLYCTVIFILLDAFGGLLNLQLPEFLKSPI